MYCLRWKTFDFYGQKIIVWIWEIKFYGWRWTCATDFEFVRFYFCTRMQNQLRSNLLFSFFAFIMENWSRDHIRCMQQNKDITHHFELHSSDWMNLHTTILFREILVDPFWVKHICQYGAAIISASHANRNFKPVMRF